MRHAFFSLFAATAITVTHSVAAEELNTTRTTAEQKQGQESFEAFTGRVNSNRVRLRLKPDLGSPIVKEMSREELVVALGEEEDFYAVKPSSEFKGYVYRTYVLDGVIEGSHVNVRLGPSIDDPVVTQLNTGDTVEGTVCSENNKWMEISLPESARFFVAKEYLDHAGDVDMIAKIEARHNALASCFDDVLAFSKDELAKEFEDINFDAVRHKFEDLIANFSEEFEEEVGKAKELLILAQDAYLQKKINFLEAKAQEATGWYEASVNPNAEVEHFNARASELADNSEQKQVTIEFYDASDIAKASRNMSRISNEAMAVWEPVEEDLFARWVERTGINDRSEFYRDEQLNSVRLTGVVEAYDRPVKNKPGNFLLRCKENKVPQAYLYSTTVDLKNCIGKELTLIAVERPNNHFAFPAYFVISTE